MSWAFACLLIFGLWLLLRPKNQLQKNYRTIEDIRKKYPKRKSREQIENLRQEAIARERARNGSNKDRYLERQKSIDKESIGKTEKILSTYLFYDKKQAARLVSSIQAKFPDKSRQWCAEKALSDLERDRQAR